MSSRSKDPGVTLVELVVTMFVMGIIAVIIANTLVSAFHSTNRMQRTTEAIDDARLVSQAIDRQLRSAMCISSPLENDSSSILQFRTLANDEPIEYTYQVRDGVVTQKVGPAEPVVLIENVGATTNNEFTQLVTPLRTVQVRIPIQSANGGVFYLETTVAGRNVWRSC